MLKMLKGFSIKSTKWKSSITKNSTTKWDFLTNNAKLEHNCLAVAF